MIDFGASVREEYIVHVERSKSTGMVLREEWMHAGQEHFGRRHKIGAPSMLRYDEGTGLLILEEWRQLSKLDREGGPAVRQFDGQNGSLRCEAWCRNDQYHRDGDAPALTYWYSDGKVQLIHYYKQGALHREAGPAKIELDTNGAVLEQSWYRKGVKIDPPVGFSEQISVDNILGVTPSP